MSQISELLDLVLDTAEKYVPIAESLTGIELPDERVIGVGRAIENMVKKAEEFFQDDGIDATILEKQDRLKRRLAEVNAHAEKTIQSLEG